MAFSPLDSALTGPLFATDAMRDCFSDQARLQAMLHAEAALARAEAALLPAGVVSPGLADAIEAVSPDRFDLPGLGRQTALSGVPTIPFLRALHAMLPEGLHGLHHGATTQDIVDTAMVLQCRAALALVAAELDAVLAGMMRMAEVHRNTPCVGRTYGQHAAPTTFGFKAAVWLTGLADAAQQLPAMRKRLLVASLGGPVGTLAGLGAHGPAVADAFARELGLGTTPLSWHTLRGRLLEAGAWLAGLLGALAKLATDVAHLASTEVGEVSEPHVPGRGGSSAMPHKRNPVSCTVILAAHSASKGHLATLMDAMAAAHERPAGLWHAEWHALPALFGLASGALREGRVLSEGLLVDAGRMAENLELTRGLLFAEAAAAALAAGIGRKAAHEVVERAAGVVRQTSRGLLEVLRGEPAAAGIDLAEALDVAPVVTAAGAWVGRATHAAEAIQEAGRRSTTHLS